MSRILSVLCLLTVFAMQANASLSISSSVGGQPEAGVNYVNFDDLAGGSTDGSTANLAGSASVGSVAVDFTPNAQAVTGDAAGLYAAPFLTTSNAVFGDNVNGADTTQYITAGSTGATAGAQVELVFTGLQNYLGILWGSIDDYNTLDFYAGGVLVESMVGTDVLDPANGNQQAVGTHYVNIYSTSLFDSVIATSDQFAFEFDNVAYGVVPEASTIAVWSILGLISLGAAYKKRKQA